MTPLHWAAYNGLTEISTMLIENKASINITDKDGMTPLYLAARERHGLLVNLLLDKGANADVKVPHRWGAEVPEAEKTYLTPLHWCARFGMSGEVLHLLKKGAQPDARDRDGMTPLYLAARGGHKIIVETLLEYKADPSIGDLEDLPPADVAANDEIRSIIRKKSGK